MDVPTHLPTPQVLDALAHVVAAALEDGDDHRAWALTRALEAVAGAAADMEQPPSPVIGRRFAMVHRRILAQAPTAGGAGTALTGERRSREVVAQARGAASVADPHPAG
ncbi:MAG TPA: hypothetical protein VM287_14545 [Egibacteraceae bacterium]|nr:hypothetical protein [Egibacteraceae bacterium]